MAQTDGSTIGRRPLAPILVAGGYPEAQERSARGRARFFSSYIASIIGRDLDDVANVRNVQNIERLLFIIAARSGGLTSFHGIGADLDLDANTVRSHTNPRRPVPRTTAQTLARQPRQPPDQ